MNTANKITVSRVFLIPVFIILVLFENTFAQLAALLIFIIAAVTDTIDGYVARKYNMVSDFGKFLDPLADKLLVTAALSALVGMNRISVWILFIITVREFIVTGLRLIAVNNGVVIAASIWGKIKTVLQLIVISIALLPFEFGQNMAIYGKITTVDILMYAVVAVTIISGYEYVAKNSSVLKDWK
jgi:CDP-diacylglycerol--glycerol-3-phosphate 3-phosphatidyltransferase